MSCRYALCVFWLFISSCVNSVLHGCWVELFACFMVQLSDGLSCWWMFDSGVWPLVGRWCFIWFWWLRDCRYMLWFDDCISCAFIASSSHHLNLLRCRLFLSCGSQSDQIRLVFCILSGTDVLCELCFFQYKV